MSSLLWLEGVDFDQHIDDTNDISIIRGASLALLAAPAAALDFLRNQRGLAGAALVFSGASLALFRLPVDVEAARGHARAVLEHLAGAGRTPERRRPVPPFAHLRFVAGVAADGDDAASVRAAQFAARVAQMAGDYPPHPLAAAARMCAFTRALPADAEIRLTAGQIERLNLGSTVDTAGRAPVSTSAKARRFYGRQVRREVLRPFAPGVARFDFTHDLHEMAAIRQPEAGRLRAPMSVAGKVAIFYADGAGFTKIREALGGRPQALARFSATVRELMEQRVLGGILDNLIGRANSADPAERAAAAYDPAPDDILDEDDRPPRLRFELLLYGGDELCFIVPAWLGLDMAALFFEAVAGAQIDGHALTFKAGLVFAPFKMPVAASRALAKAVAETARIDGGGALAVRCFESIEPPANGLAAYDKAQFGDPDGADGGKAAAFARRALAIPADEVGPLIAGLRALKAADIPRSQLYRALKIAQWTRDEGNPGAGPRDWPRGLGTPSANRLAHAALSDYAGPKSGDPAWRRLCDGDPADAALTLWLLTQLWDYAEPIAFIAVAREAA